MGADDESYRRRRRRGGRRQRQRYDSSDSDEEDVYNGQRRGQRQKKRRAQRAHFTDWTDSEEDDDDDYDEQEHHRSKSKKHSRGHGRSHDEHTEAHGKGRSKPSRKEAPSHVLLKGSGRGHVAAAWDLVAGMYEKLDESFNDHPAYKSIEGDTYYLFWSQYGDWKLAERLKDDGHCVAFAEDARGRRSPWNPGGPSWRIFDPKTRRFVFRRLRVQACEHSGGGGQADEEQDAKSCEEDEVPWSRGHWSTWSTTDLLRWCRRQGVDVEGVFDREVLLERVIDAASTASSTCAEGRRGQHTLDEDDTSSSDSDRGSPHRHNGRGRTARRQVNLDLDVQMASRVKTDGSYTRRPSLDPRSSHYGNRIEQFCGDEDTVLPWLYRFGDKSRLYGIFLDGQFGYSMVWKKQKYWGRAMYKSNRRSRESWE